MFLRPIRDPRSVTAITGARPLAMVPLIAPDKRNLRKGKRREGRRRFSLRRRRVEASESSEGLIENG